MTYRRLPQFVVRTPALAFDVLARWSEHANPRAYLRALVEDPVVREALYVASPELDGQIESWLREPDTQAAVAIERALVRYISRMAGRSTPFGLFSAVSVGEVGPTRLAIAPRADAVRHTRLDNDFLFALCSDLARDRAVRTHLRYRPNTSLYQAADRLRYAEARRVGPFRTYHLIAVDRTPYLDALLARAAHGATVDELAAVLAADPDITAEEAAAFVHEVIDAQILLSDLAPNVTGCEPTLGIADRLDALPQLATPLRAAHAALAAIDGAAPGNAPEVYRAVAQQLAAGVPTKPEPSRLFQVDLFKPNTVALDESVLGELRGAIDLLHKLTPPTGDAWARFRQKFAARYESREVPLVEALDEEVGIGFGDDTPITSAPLLGGLTFPTRGGDLGQVSLGPREYHLMSLIAHALRSGATEIELTDDDIAKLSSTAKPPLHDTVSVSAVLVAANEQAVADGNFQLRLQHISGGANLLGRFCHGSPEIAALTERALRAEESVRPDAIFAEIVHLPDGRIGNILARPVLREFEIPFLGASGAASDKQITIDDLLISIVGDRVVLRSRRLDKEVIPRMTTAHNFGARGLAVYKFLCAHQYQQVTNAIWSWGAIADFPFLPRVRRGKVILERARWRLTPQDLAPLETAFAGWNAAKAPAQIAEIRGRAAAAIAAMRARLALPRWIVIADGDNELVVDLDNELMVDSCAHLLKGRQGAIVYELLPAPDQLAFRGSEGAFAHELIVLFERASEPRKSTAPARDVELASRRFLPGSPWLYLKLYTGPATADHVLRDYVAPAVDAAIARGLASSWFFIRYADPDWHVRLRFTGDPRTLTSHLLPALHEALAPASERGLIWKIVVDTYEREIERYGGVDGTDLAEQLFGADSEAVLAILRAYEGDAASDAMWRCALRGIDTLLDDLGLSLADKLRTLTTARDSFGAEFAVDTAFQKKLGDKYRAYGKDVAALLATPAATYEPAVRAFAARSERLAPITTKLRELADAGRLGQSIDDLVHSYIHMHVNRMIRSAARAHELVLYDLLRRHYQGQIARAGKKSA